MTCHCHAGRPAARFQPRKLGTRWLAHLAERLSVQLLAGHSEPTQLWAAVFQQLCDETRL